MLFLQGNTQAINNFHFCAEFKGIRDANTLQVIISMCHSKVSVLIVCNYGRAQAQTFERFVKLFLKNGKFNAKKRMSRSNVRSVLNVPFDYRRIYMQLLIVSDEDLFY